MGNQNPRKFFEFVYLKMYENWAELIMADGFTVTKPEEINIIANNNHVKQPSSSFNVKKPVLIYSVLAFCL